MKNILYAVVLLLTIGLLSSSVILINLLRKKEPKPTIVYVTEPEPVEREVIEMDIWQYIVNIKIQHPDIVFTQCQIETAHFTHWRYTENNNCLGMKYPKKRPTTAIGEDKDGYAIYSHWKHSIHDYLIWQIMYCYNMSKEDYLDYLDNVYAESGKDGSYSSLIIRILKNK